MDEPIGVHLRKLKVACPQVEGWRCNTMFKRLLAIACLLGFRAVSVGGQVEERAVIDNDLALCSAVPLNWDYRPLGNYGGALYESANDPHNQKWLMMQPDALKGGLATYLQHLYMDLPNDPLRTKELLAFEADEVRQGRDPIFITATYGGEKRPVLLALNLPGGLAAKLYGPNKVQAVNIRDDRYIKFCVNYLRGRLSILPVQNWIVCFDNSGYRQEWYVVVDDVGQYHQVKWDRPFPQTNEEWTDAAQYALGRIKDLAPDLILYHNAFVHPLADDSRYGQVFAAIDGSGPEAFMYWGIYNFEGNRNNFWDGISRLLPPDGPDANKIQFFGWTGLTEEGLQRSFLAYLIFSGPNAFYAPDDGPAQWPPSCYAGVKNKLGIPVDFMQSVAEPGDSRGYRIWWRRCQGGIVYLNSTGFRKSIVLPTDRPYYDPSGKHVSSITLDDLAATYVTSEVGERVAKPRINPRRPGFVTGPVTITLETEPFTPASDCKIVYTVDGTEPNESSAAYSGPFEICESCVVKARAFPSGVRRFPPLQSFTSFATYSLANGEPTVEFHHASDNGSEFLEHDYPVVSLSHVSAHPVTVRYQPLGGSARQGQDYALEPGTLTIRPGEQHRYFYVHIVNDAAAELDETLTISISDPVNATLGENTMYTYTIEDNDRDPNHLIGDLDFDGRVGITDLIALCSHWLDPRTGPTPARWQQFYFDDSGIVNFRTFAVLAENYQSVIPGPFPVAYWKLDETGGTTRP